MRQHLGLISRLFWVRRYSHLQIHSFCDPNHSLALTSPRLCCEQCCPPSNLPLWLQPLETIIIPDGEFQKKGFYSKYFFVFKISKCIFPRASQQTALVYFTNEMSETQKKVGYTAWGGRGGRQIRIYSRFILSKKQGLLVNVTHTQIHTPANAHSFQDSSVLLLMCAANPNMRALLSLLGQHL